MNISTVIVPFLLDREQLPGTWTGLVELIMERTGETAAPQVQTNILGILLAMAQSNLSAIGRYYGRSEDAEQASGLLRAGNNSIVECRSCLSGCEEAFDFEVIKTASILASDQSRQARADAGYPYPDLWPHSLSAFSFA